MGPLGRLTAGGLLLALAGGACGDLDANDQPFVGTVPYADPNGAFSIRLLEPPWLPPFLFADQTITVVPPTDATITTDPGVILGEALYSLQIAPQPGDPTTLMQAVRSALPLTADAVQETVVTASGARGVELSWKESETIFHRDVFLAGLARETYKLHFTAKHAIGDDPMVTQMVLSYDAR